MPAITVARRVLVIGSLTILVVLGCEKSGAPPAQPVDKTETAVPATQPAESSDEPSKAVPGTTLVQLDVEGMHCQDCGDTIARRLRALPGVKQARVSFNAKTGWVLIESGSATGGPQLLEAVGAAGYRATLAPASAPSSGPRAWE